MREYPFRRRPATAENRLLSDRRSQEISGPCRGRGSTGTRRNRAPGGAGGRSRPAAEAVPGGRDARSVAAAFSSAPDDRHQTTRRHPSAAAELTRDPERVGTPTAGHPTALPREFRPSGRIVSGDAGRRTRVSLEGPRRADPISSRWLSGHSPCSSSPPRIRRDDGDDRRYPSTPAIVETRAIRRRLRAGRSRRRVSPVLPPTFHQSRRSIVRGRGTGTNGGHAGRQAHTAYCVLIVVMAQYVVSRVPDGSPAHLDSQCSISHRRGWIRSGTRTRGGSCLGAGGRSFRARSWS